MAPKSSKAKAERERKKLEEQQRLAALEAERLQQEAEEEARRLEQLRIEEEERQKQQEERERRFAVEQEPLNMLLIERSINLPIEREKVAEEVLWKRFLACDPAVDETYAKGLNRYVTEWKDMSQDSKAGLGDTLKEWQDAYQLLARMEQHRKTLEEEFEIQHYLEIKANILEVMKTKLDVIAHQMLETSEPHINRQTFNLEKSHAVKDMVYHLWGNTAKNPRLKNIEMGNRTRMPVSVSVPKELALANFAVRVIYTHVDTLSPTCSTFRMGKPKAQSMDTNVSADVPAGSGSLEGEGEGSGGGGGDVAGSKAGSKVALDSRSTTSLTAKTADTGKPESTRSSRPNEEKRPDSATSNTSRDAVEDDDDCEGDEEGGDGAKEKPYDPDFPDYEPNEGALSDDEHAVDLRAFQQVGGVFYFDILQLPPQPMVCGQWTMQEVLEGGLRYTTYPLPDLKKTVVQDDDEISDTPAPTAPEKEVEEIEIQFRATKEMYLQDAKVARWDSSRLCWRTDEISDMVIKEKNGEVSFKTVHVMPFTLFQSRYSSLPIEYWDVRPIDDGQVLLTICARTVEMDIIVKGHQCKIPKLPDIVDSKGKDKGTDESQQEKDILEHFRERWMIVDEFQERLTRAGINIFPEEDGHKYTEVVRKARAIEDLIYHHAALLSPAFSLASSSKNGKFDRNVAVIKVSESGGDERIPDEMWTLFAVQDDCTWQLKMREEEEAEPNLDVADQQDLHADLYCAVQAVASADSAAAIAGASALQVHTVHQLLERIRPLVYS
eukprot:scpid15208/ scgid1682/ Cancer susceptibility candidate protein 1 homolog